MCMVCCWLRDFFEEAGISCSLATFVCGSDHGSLFLYDSHWVRLVRCESLWGVVAFYNDCITHPEIIGFHVRFSISVLLYFSLGFGVTLPNAGVFSNGCDQVWQAVFLWSGQIGLWLGVRQWCNVVSSGSPAGIIQIPASSFDLYLRQL